MSRSFKHTAQRLPKNSHFFAPADGLEAVGGSDVPIASPVAWRMGNANTDIEFVFSPQQEHIDHWTTLAIDLLWSNTDGADTGDVRWRYDVRGYSSGDTVAGPSYTAYGEVTAGATGVIATTTIATSVSLPDKAFVVVTISRNGSHGNDTHLTNVDLHGVVIRQAS